MAPRRATLLRGHESSATTRLWLQRSENYMEWKTCALEIVDGIAETGKLGIAQVCRDGEMLVSERINASCQNCFTRPCTHLPILGYSLARVRWIVDLLGEKLVGGQADDDVASALEVPEEATCRLGLDLICG